jgi:hypothetical protein
MHYALLASFAPTSCTLTIGIFVAFQSAFCGKGRKSAPSEANKVIPFVRKDLVLSGKIRTFAAITFSRFPARRKSSGKQMSGPEHATGGMG